MNLRSKKILVNKTFLSLSKDNCLTMPLMFGSKQKIIMTVNGKLEFLILKPAYPRSKSAVGNLNMEHNFTLGKDPAMNFTFLSQGSSELGYRPLKISKYSTQQSLHTVLNVVNSDKILCVCYEIEKKHSVVFYEVTDNLQSDGPLGLEYRGEADRGFFEGENVRGIFLVNKKLLGVALDSSFLFIDLNNIESPTGFKVKIKNPGYGIREFSYDCARKRLYFTFGRVYNLVSIEISTLSIAGYYDLIPLLNNLHRTRKPTKALHPAITTIRNKDFSLEQTLIEYPDHDDEIAGSNLRTEDENSGNEFESFT